MMFCWPVFIPLTLPNASVGLTGCISIVISVLKVVTNVGSI